MTQALTYCEVDVPHCGNTYSLSPCRARLMGANYTQAAVNFTGTTLARGADLTSSADLKTGMLSLWFRIGGGNGTARVILSNTGDFFRVSINTSNKLQVIGLNAASATILNYISNTTFVFGESYHHVMISWSLSISRLQCYIDGVLDSGSTATTVNDNIDYTRANWAIGATTAGANQFNGDMADLWFDQATTVDLSVAASRAKFISLVTLPTAAAVPVDLGADGSTPGLGVPDIFLSGSLASWNTNKGTGGGFTISGALTQAVGDSGQIKCFNTRNTCQAIDTYVATTPITYRFAKPTAYLPNSIEAIPSILEVSLTPAVVSLGKDLGQRASVSITFEDHPDDDTTTGFDPYLSTRTYNPFQQGTFWGKFRARNPFIVGSKLRLIFGYVGQALAEMETRHYIIDSYEGPTPRGKFTLRASDVLKLGDAEKAVAPLPSNGYLLNNITAVQTAITILPAGAGAEYATGLPQYLNIGGKEIVNCTARAGDVLTITRAQLGTTAQTANSGDRVQKILKYVSADPADIIYDLCTTYIPNFDASWIDLPTWQTETATYNGNTYTGYVTEPTAVKTLLEELILQCALALWWDDINEELRLQVLHAISTSAFDFTPDNMKRGSLAITERLDTRLSQIVIYFGQVNPLLPLSNKDNFRSTTVISDSDSEDNWGQPAIQTILSRWIPSAGRTVADRLGAILLGRYKTPPRQVSFDVQRFAETDPELGGGYHFACDFVQDETGATSGVFLPIQVTELKASGDSYSVKAEEMLFDVSATDLTNRNVVFASNAKNLNLRTEHDSIYPAPTGTETVTFTLNSGVRIGSASYGASAVIVGSWPAGTTVRLILTTGSRIEGPGGAGGVGGGGSGAAGGTALFTRRAISLTNNGIIAGGGGGGGGSQYISAGVQHLEFTAGGGGGAGIIGGPGGGHYIAPGATGGANGGGAGGANTAPGGAGGAPGLAGSAGTNVGSGSAGSGGAAGTAVDGTSFVTYTLAGDIRGGQIN